MAVSVICRLEVMFADIACCADVRIAPHAMVTLIVADYLGWVTK